ncbi:hypothetical protein E2C01_012799 [Portunus trituberculatus]|uniref:Uncharacterized protein n=1 Tax=Portunus trituberculatus TaxID=210409 RepID=A0A5B7DEZ1_PORTR|nr:hypothetical protein [Portunus trituberculatus]
MRIYKAVQYLDMFPYLFCLLYGDFIQLQKLIYGIKM